MEKRNSLIIFCYTCIDDILLLFLLVIFLTDTACRRCRRCVVVCKDNGDDKCRIKKFNKLFFFLHSNNEIIICNVAWQDRIHHRTPSTSYDWLNVDFFPHACQKSSAAAWPAADLLWTAIEWLPKTINVGVCQTR